MLIIKKAKVYGPEDLGVKDILIVGNRIESIAEEIMITGTGINIEEISAKGLTVVPGFIDQHVHLVGGGGEEGPTSRTPEVQLSDLASCGITTAIGLLGVDGVTRSVESLLAKARGLEEEGLSTYIYTGAYQIPTRTVSGNVRSDLILIDKVLGVGELAIADHRSTNPGLAEFIKIASEARVGGLLGNKAGVVHIHLGSGKEGMKLLFEVIEKTDIPIGQFIPSHINRTSKLLEQAKIFACQGGTIDLTAGFYSDSQDDGITIGEAITFLLQSGVDPGKITVSSDANGSSPVFDDYGNLLKLEVGSPKVLWFDLKNAVINNNIPIDLALSFITNNVARHLKLRGKGRVVIGNDADLVFLNNDLDIVSVMSKGIFMVKNYKIVKKGKFEN